MHTATSSLFLLTSKCWTVRCPVTNQVSETDYVMKLHSMITEKLLMHQDKCQPQMPSMRSKIS